jgi:hypothetical protein
MRKRLEHLILECAYTLINFIIYNVCKNIEGDEKNDMSEMVIQGREMIQDALDNEEKNNKITEKYLKNLKKKELEI